MADVDNDAQDDDDILEMAKAVYKVDKDHWDSLVYEKAKEDLHFLSDERGAMWDAKEYERREKTGRRNKLFLAPAPEPLNIAGRFALNKLGGRTN